MVTCGQAKGHFGNIHKAKRKIMWLEMYKDVLQLVETSEIHWQCTIMGGGHNGYACENMTNEVLGIGKGRAPRNNILK